MANTEDLKSSEVIPLVGSSPTSGTTYNDLTRSPVSYNEPKWKQEKRLLWCNSHQRRAYRCKTEGGILIPCQVVDLTDKVEIDDP